MQVDQHVDAAIADGVGRFAVAHRVNRDHLVAGPLQARAVRGAIFGAEVERRDVDARPVVRLEQLRHEQADRVGAEIARQVANPQPAILGRPRRRARDVRERVLAADEEVRRQPLHRRVVLERQHRQRRGGGGHVVRRDSRERLVDRPGALLLAQMDPMLDGVGLGGVELEAVREGGFGRRVVAARFLKASDVVEGQ